MLTPFNQNNWDGRYKAYWQNIWENIGIEKKIVQKVDNIEINKESKKHVLNPEWLIANNFSSMFLIC